MTDWCCQCVNVNTSSASIQPARIRLYAAKFCINHGNTMLPVSKHTRFQFSIDDGGNAASTGNTCGQTQSAPLLKRCDSGVGPSVSSKYPSEFEALFEMPSGLLGMSSFMQDAIRRAAAHGVSCSATSTSKPHPRNNPRFPRGPTAKSRDFVKTTSETGLSKLPTRQVWFTRSWKMRSWAGGLLRQLPAEVKTLGYDGLTLVQ